MRAFLQRAEGDPRAVQPCLGRPDERAAFGFQRRHGALESPQFGDQQKIPVSRSRRPFGVGDDPRRRQKPAQLAMDRPDLEQLVTLRYFAGLTLEQAAASLGMSVRTAERNWTYVRTWLREASA